MDYNTYFNNSVLAHVLMPYGFAVSLGFKFYNTNKVLKEALIGRLGENDEKIRVGPRSYDGTYTELTLEDCGHKVLVQSACVDERLYLLITPKINVKRPPALLISAYLLWNKSGSVERTGDILMAALPDGKMVTVQSDGTPERQMNTGFTHPWLAVTLDRPVAVSTDDSISAFDVAKIMERQKVAVLAECGKYGELSECYNAMRTCIAWNTIYEPEKARLCTPVSRLWSISWGGYVLFDWDTYFSAMMASVENRELSYANAIAITGEKTEGGFIPNFGAADDNKSRDRSQPPVGSLAVKEIYRRFGDKQFVCQLFDDLLEWNTWFAKNRRLPNGQLCWGSNPFEGKKGGHWETEGVGDRFGAALESGLDNSPMYDDIPFNKQTHMLELADVGLTGLYIMDCEALAELADVLGRTAEAASLRERAKLSKKGLEELWEEEFGMYLNRRTDNGEFSYRISPTNFYALFSDSVSPERVRRMVDEHYFNEDEFHGEFVMPSIARNDAAYPEQEYWRGRIWPPMNFLVYLAMRRHKQLGDARRDLAERSKNLLLKEWELNGHIHENYNADSGMGCDVGSSDRFLCWGGLLALTALMEAGYVEGPENALGEP